MGSSLEEIKRAILLAVHYYKRSNQWRSYEQDRDVKKLLFESVDGNPPLFSSQRALAKAVSQRKYSPYYMKEKMLTVFLNQIFKNNKNCPKELAQEIFRTILNDDSYDYFTSNRAEFDIQLYKKLMMDRNYSGGHPSSWTKDIALKIFKILLSKSRIKESARGNETDQEWVTRLQVEDIFSRQEQTKEVVIVNPRLLEMNGHPMAGRFISNVMEMLIEADAKYLFISDRTRLHVAWRLWMAVSEGIKQIVGYANAHGELGNVHFDLSDAIDDVFNDFSGNSRIRLIGVESDLCILPYIIFDPQQIDQCEMYLWDWWTKPVEREEREEMRKNSLGDIVYGDDWLTRQKGEVVNSIASVGPWTKKQWIDNFYETLSDPGRTIQVKYQDFLDAKKQQLV